MQHAFDYQQVSLHLPAGKRRTGLELHISELKSNQGTAYEGILVVLAQSMAHSETSPIPLLGD